MRRVFTVIVLASLSVITTIAGARQGSNGSALTAGVLKGLEFRSIGPALATGRIQDVQIDPKNPNVWYVASAFGGLWKTTNRGITFTPIFEEGGSFTLCCVAIDPKDSNVVWLATGENTSQRSAHFGDGVYKSTDAGATWKRVGLAASEHIGRLLIDPRNSNVVYVAAQGPLFAPGGERGVFKTTDGGQTWQPSLTISADTGANDLAFDPKNPDVLYASAYQRRRAVGQLIGGGPEGGIYKTTNAGRSWTKLTKGLAAGDVGRIALATDGRKSPATVFALINAQLTEAGFYRSDDGGASWSRIGHMQPPAGRAGRAGGAGGAKRRPSRRTRRVSDRWRTGRLLSRRRSAVLLRALRRSVQARHDLVGEHESRSQHGRRSQLQACRLRRSRHARRPSRRGVGSGRPPAHAGRQRRRSLRNLRRGQDVAVLRESAGDAVLPRLGRQHEAVLPRLRRRAGQLVDVRSVAHGQPLGHPHQRLVHRRRRRRIPDPQRSRRSEHRVRAVAGRRITRLDLRTGDVEGIRPRQAGAAPREEGDPRGGAGEGQERQEGGQGGSEERERPDGREQAGGAGRAAGGAGQAEGLEGQAAAERPTAPTGMRRTSISPHSSRRLYWASNRSIAATIAAITGRRSARTCRAISIATTSPIMGRVWPADAVSRNQATTALSNIVALDESPLLEGLIYAGTDDGLLQVTEDGGKNWRKIEQFPGVPQWTYVSDVFASPRDANAVFVALNNWQRGDYKPYLLKSIDRGRPGRRSPAICRTGTTSGPSPGSCQRQPVVCRDGVRRLHERRRRRRTGSRSKAACRWRRSAISRCSAARTTS